MGRVDEGWGGGREKRGGGRGGCKGEREESEDEKVARDEETPIGSSRAGSRRPKPRKEKQISSNSSSEEGPLSKTVQEHSC